MAALRFSRDLGGWVPVSIEPRPPAAPSPAPRHTRKRTHSPGIAWSGGATESLHRLFADDGPEHDRQQWRKQAICQQVDPEIFFPEQGEPSIAAKRVCSGCPVRAECLEHALAVPETWGVWGGLSYDERCRLKRQRGQIAA